MKNFLGSFLFILLGIFTALGGLYLEAGHLHSILQSTSFLIVLGATFGFVLLYYPLVEIAKAFKISLKSDVSPENEVFQAIKIFETSRKGAIFGGCLGAFLGVFHVGMIFTVPDKIGPGVAVCLVSLLYGAFLNSFCFLPLEMRLLCRIHVSPTAVSTERGEISFLRISIALIIFFFSILFGSLLEGAMLSWYLSSSVTLITISGPLALFLPERNFFYNFPNKLNNAASKTIFANAFISSAVAAIIIGLINVMENLDEPTKLIERISLTFLPTFYGGISYFLLISTNSADDSIKTITSGKDINIFRLGAFGIFSAVILLFTTSLVLLAIK